MSANLYDHTACLTAEEILACLTPIFKSIREKEGFTQAIGFLHPVSEGRVTLSAHGCVAHSWTRRITASAASSRTSSSTDLSRKISTYFIAGNRSSSDLTTTPDRKASAPAHLHSTLPRVPRALPCHLTCTNCVLPLTQAAIVSTLHECVLCCVK